jgi:hypothetical protein
MEAEHSTTKRDRVFINTWLYLRILQAKENHLHVYKVARLISHTAYPNGTVITY